MKDFEFHRPTTIADAVALLQGAAARRSSSPGGQSLLPVLKLELAEPSDLISLAGHQGAARHPRRRRPARDRRARHPRRGPPLGRGREARSRRSPQLAGGIGDAQVRNRGTIGGSVAHADPAADYPGGAARRSARRSSTDRRTIAADDFFTGLFETALARDELVTAVHVPGAEARGATSKFAHRASKYALVGVMVAETAAGVRVAVTGAAPTVFRVPAMEAALAKKLRARRARRASRSPAGRSQRRRRGERRVPRAPDRA